MSEQPQQHLVETDWLEAHLADPAIRIVDMRGQVHTKTMEPGVQKADYRGCWEQYLEGHIPGAVYVDWTRDIVDGNDPVPAQVAPPEAFARAMEARGIGDQSLVVAYDDHPASQFATRLWWALRYYGHPQVRVLNGGWKRWTAEGRPVSTDVPSPASSHFTPRLAPSWRATAADVLARIGQPGQTLVDARDEGQYSGAVRRGPRGGHIPGAIHLPRERLIGPDGSWVPPERLRQIVEEVGLSPAQHVTAYCNGGVAATSVLFMLDILGYPSLSNYDGSWNEWSEREELPVEE